MSRRFEECPSRAPLDPDDGSGRAICGMVARVTGARDAAIAGVGRDACEACCRSLLPGEDLNPVVASLVFEAAGAILRAGGVAGCDADRARSVRERIVSHLAIVHAAMDDRSFPPEAVHSNGAGSDGPGLGWAVGVITAPRSVPTLHLTLRGLDAAGFGPVRIFAEPGSWIPPEAGRHRVDLHPGRLGNFANFYNALTTLYRDNPGARCIALFQDDVVAAAGLKAWCEAELWPQGAGLVSLFTPRAHADDRAGWRLHSPGYYRVYGAQALAFRRDVLEAFLADPHALREVRSGRRADDAVLAAWAARRGTPIAYHTPSLVQHIGMVSSLFKQGPDRRVFADAVASVDRIASWSPPPRSRGRVGLVGWNTRTGLGYQNHDLARHLGVDRWLVPPHPYCPDPVDGDPGCGVDHIKGRIEPDAIRDWLDGLDWVVFIERPYLPGLAHLARQMQVGVACVPNWEWLGPRLNWLSYVDLMICPTRHTHALALDWRRRYGFGWETRLVPWPVDTDRFRFIPRRRCERFVFANGWGGKPGRRLDGSTTSYGRKGLELIVAAARAAPRLPFIVYSQHRKLPRLPRNIELRPAPDDNRRLYDDGDVCVQPSHFEGLGLQLLECQAAGMPLVTTDAPPMNEYRPLAAIPTVGTEVIQIHVEQPVASNLMGVADLMRILDGLLGSDIAEASRRARAFIEREHSWEAALPALNDGLAVY
ncbi:MAG TPA: glycosyltransferase [Isosphaeraceae bacterium]